MGFWSKLFGRKDERSSAAAGTASPAVPPPAPAGPAAAPTPHRPPGQGGSTDGSDAMAEQLTRLERLGKKGGASASDALLALRQTHGRPEQTPVLHAILRALGKVAGHEQLRVASAGVLVDRGQHERALELVAPCRSVEGMMLAAELHAAEGDLARALSTIERVMARAIDTPGARERHERWSTQLGRSGARPRTPVDDGATVVAPSGPQTPFRLLREVARGGAGTIYEAEDELLGRRLAYKVYHRAERDHEQIAREARAAVELAGPGVLRVFDADPEAGWLATEWLPRGSLRDLLRDGRWEELLPLHRWLLPLLAAIERVHHGGLVHADIKPGNVLFRDLDEPLLGDFGICRRQGEESLSGTPGYLAPERLAGGPADPRDDVYAIGRIIEDVLAALEQAAAKGPLSAAPSAEQVERYEWLSRACLADASARPANATAVRALLTG